MIDLKKTLQLTLKILKRSLTKSNLHDLKKKKRTTTKLQENTTKVLKTGDELGENIYKLSYKGLIFLMFRVFFLGSNITADSDCSHKIKDAAPWKKSYDNPRQFIRKQRHPLLTKV